MGFWKHVSALLGFAKDEKQQHEAINDSSIESSYEDSVPFQHLQRKGFSVSVQVPVERAPPSPLLKPCPTGDGGVQGLSWYANRLKIDEDGDVADEFFVEVSPDSSTSIEEQNMQLSRFEVEYNTKNAIVRNQVLLPNGKIQHLVEFQGKLEWV